MEGGAGNGTGLGEVVVDDLDGGAGDALIAVLLLGGEGEAVVSRLGKSLGDGGFGGEGGGSVAISKVPGVEEGVGEGGVVDLAVEGDGGADFMGRCDDDLAVVFGEFCSGGEAGEVAVALEAVAHHVEEFVGGGEVVAGVDFEGTFWDEVDDAEAVAEVAGDDFIRAALAEDEGIFFEAFVIDEVGEGDADLGEGGDFALVFLGENVAELGAFAVGLGAVDAYVDLALDVVVAGNDGEVSEGADEGVVVIGWELRFDGSFGNDGGFVLGDVPFGEAGVVTDEELVVLEKGILDAEEGVLGGGEEDFLDVVGVREIVGDDLGGLIFAASGGVGSVVEAGAIDGALVADFDLVAVDEGGVGGVRNVEEDDAVFIGGDGGG